MPMRTDRPGLGARSAVQRRDAASDCAVFASGSWRLVSGSAGAGDLMARCCRDTFVVAQSTVSLKLSDSAAEVRVAKAK